jgi:copper resistance protein B
VRRADIHRDRVLAILIMTGLLAGPVAATDMNAAMGGPKAVAYLSLDRLEAQLRDGSNAWAWDAEGWFGGDLDKLWIKTKGEDDQDTGLEQAELQLLYSRAVAAFWDLQLGVRHDMRPNPSKTYAVVGVEGTAPYRIDIDAAAFVSEDGDASARVEAEYDLRLNQRWVLQPRAELDVAFSQTSELDVGRGPSKLETGLRLRYEFLPEFAPYLGVRYESALGNSRGLVKDAGDSRSTWSAVLGIHAWF